MILVTASAEIVEFEDLLGALEDAVRSPEDLGKVPRVLATAIEDEWLTDNRWRHQSWNSIKPGQFWTDCCDGTAHLLIEEYNDPEAMTDAEIEEVFDRRYGEWFDEALKMAMGAWDAFMDDVCYGLW